MSSAGEGSRTTDSHKGCPYNTRDNDIVNFGLRNGNIEKNEVMKIRVATLAVLFLLIINSGLQIFLPSG